MYARKRSDVMTPREQELMRWGDMAEARIRYSLGDGTIRKLAEEAGAIARFGGSVRYDFKRIDMYLEKIQTQ